MSSVFRFREGGTHGPKDLVCLGHLIVEFGA